MSDHERWMWLPLLGLALGGGVPLMLVDLPDGSWSHSIAGAVFTSMAVFAWAAFKRIGNRFPHIKHWSENSLLGVTLLVFVFSLITTTASVLFAVLPVPNWIHIAIAVLLAFSALAVLINAFGRDPHA